MADAEWNKLATNVIKGELARAGVNYEELIRRLKEHGIEESYTGIAAKINRGSFTFIFFMQCMMALGKTEIRL